jgi:hypothetical protein
MGPSHNQMFRDLVAYLSAPSLKIEYATEALKEWILHRRSKGDTLFEVSIGLAELEEQVGWLVLHAFVILELMELDPTTYDDSIRMGKAIYAYS